MTTQENSASHAPHAGGERLQKVLAAAGFGSRRACEEFITTGRVAIDGQVVTDLGVRVDIDCQRVTVDGERVKPQAKKYYLVYKPPGVLCTNSDPGGRPRVIDLLPPMETRLFTVGRLDEATEGLLMVTNDGELAHRLAHPRFQVERHYRVLVAGEPTGQQLEEIQQGLYFSDGRFRVRGVKKVKSKGQSTLLDVILTEGQNREVRRLFARIGHKVMSLQRIQFGPLRLGNLESGEYRPLRKEELDRLREVAMQAPQKRTRRPAPTGPRKKPARASASGRPEAPTRPERPARAPFKKAVRRTSERPAGARKKLAKKRPPRRS